MTSDPRTNFTREEAISEVISMNAQINQEFALFSEYDAINAEFRAILHALGITDEEIGDQL